MISADLHNHTTYSIDSITSPRVLVEQLTIHAKIKVAAITDHNNIRGIEETQRLASTYKDVLIIPGVEISTTQGDLLILGTEVLPPEPWNIENLVDVVDMHPSRGSASGWRFDAVDCTGLGSRRVIEQTL